MQTKRTMLLIGLTVSAIAVAWSTGGADVPRTINYQGRLMDNDGFPLNGTYDMVFSIHADSTCPAADTLWTEEHSTSNGHPVEVADGMFEVLLGSVNPLANDPIFSGSPLWLGVIVQGDTLCPLKPISSVAHSIRTALGGDTGGAGDGHSLDAHDGSPENVVYVDDDGRVGIGTTTPTTDLTLYPRFSSAAVISAGSPGGEDSRRIILSGGDDWGNDRGAYIEAFGNGYGVIQNRGKLVMMAGDSSYAAIGVGGSYKVVVDENGGVAVGGGTPPNNGLLVAGNVGVGTQNPAEKMDVNGTLQTSGFKMPTGASDTFVLTCDSLGIASWEPSSGSRVPKIRYADRMPGTNAYEKISAAIDSLPPEGGIVDARGLEGSQVLNGNVFADVGDRTLTLILGNAEFDVQAEQIFSGAAGGLRFCGIGEGTVLRADGVAAILTLDISASNGGERICQISDMRFDLSSDDATAIFLRRARFASRIERISVVGASGTSPCIMDGVNGDDLSCHYSVFRDLEIFGSGRTANGIEIRSDMVTVDHVHFVGLNAGVYIDIGTMSTPHIFNSIFAACTYALKVDRNTPTSVVFAHNYCESDYRDTDVWIAGSGAAWPELSVTIRDNYFTGLGLSGQKAIYLEHVKGVVIEGNLFRGKLQVADGTAVVFGTNVSEVQLSGNIVDRDLSPTMPGCGSVPLPIDDVTVTQSSTDFGVGRSLTLREVLTLKPTTTPAAPDTGAIYMDEGTLKLMVFDGTTWQACW